MFMYTRIIRTLIGDASFLQTLEHTDTDIRRHLNNIVTGDVDSDDIVFDDDVSTTVDTGWLLFIIASVISVLSVALLPVSVRIGRYVSSTHLFCKGKDDSAADDSESGEVEEPSTSTSLEEGEPQTLLQKVVAWFLNHLIYRWEKRSSTRKQHHGDRIEAIKRARSKEARVSMLIVAETPMHVNGNGDIELSLRANQQRGASRRFLRRRGPLRSVISIVMDLIKKRRRRTSQRRDRDHQINAFRFDNKWDLFKSIVRFDHETKRILRLAIPFTISAIIYTVCDLIILGFVSRYLGTDAMMAFAMVDLITGSK